MAKIEVEWEWVAEALDRNEELELGLNHGTISFLTLVDVVDAEELHVVEVQQHWVHSKGISCRTLNHTYVECHPVEGTEGKNAVRVRGRDKVHRPMLLMPTLVHYALSVEFHFLKFPWHSCLHDEGKSSDLHD